MDVEWNLTTTLTFLAAFWTSVFLLKYNWQRRYLYYYASKIPGPFSLPLIGCVQVLFFDRKDLLRTFVEFIRKYPPVLKGWFATKLYIVTSRPQDVEIVLGKCLEKAAFYDFFTVQCKNSLLAAPLDLWKVQRKIINHSFSSKVLNSNFHCIVKYAKDVVQTLDSNCGKEETDLFSKIWKCNLYAATETMFDLNPGSVDGIDNCILWATRFEKIIIERFHCIWLHLNLFWKYSSLGRQCKSIENQVQTFTKKMLNLKLSQSSKVGETKKKYFVNNLFERNVPLNQLVEESSLMYIAASETISVVEAYIILVLGMYPDIQEKVYQEQVSIFADDDRDPTLEDLSKMDYLERVIKETMRLIPAVPFIMRSIDQDIYSDPYMFPAGSDVFIPLMLLHRSPELWPDPLKFDPDRFLPEELGKRHRCAYIPFSFGARNCIGLQYAMVAMKTMVSAVVKSFKVKTSNWKSMEDIEFEFHVLTKPTGYKLIINRRNADVGNE